VPVPLADPALVAAIGDLAGNVGFATNTITLNLTTNAAYAYDMAGNVTNINYNAGEQTVALSWNSQYELTAVHTNGALAESYAYDALGRRVRTSTCSVTNFHLYEGIHCTADLDATGAVVRAYVYGPGIDNLLAMTTYSATETNTYYYLTDHLGSVIAITDGQGDVVEQYRYDAWGRVTVFDQVGTPLTESAIGNRYTFQGREYSWPTGFHYFRARWYDPVTGRWLSNDPIGISGGLNQYVAFDNAPVMYSDPLAMRVLLMGSDEEKEAILDDLRKFVRGSLSTDPKGYLVRSPSEDDDMIESMVDELIHCDAVFRITRAFPPDGVVPGVFRPTRSGPGGDIFYDPKVNDRYRSGAFRTSPFTAPGLLAHELLGRAYANLHREPTGAMYSKTRHNANTKAVERANPAFERMGMPKRTSY
jgi:RHS repeat-associated protein